MAFGIVAGHRESEQPDQPDLSAGYAVGPSTVMLAALLAHAVSLYLAVNAAGGVRFGFAHILSAAMWIGVGLLWLERKGAHTMAMRTLALPIAALAAPMPMLFTGASIQPLTGSVLFVPHIVVGILAYAVMVLAVIHALLMAMAQQSLQGGAGATRVLVDRLPPLLTMERFLFRMLAIGFLLLTLTVVSGWLFAEQLFGQPFRFDHKTVFTLLAWIVLGILLAGRYWRGWRGRTALRLTLTGFVVLILGYAGSRFVLEVILQRA